MWMYTKLFSASRKYKANNSSRQQKIQCIIFLLMLAKNTVNTILNDITKYSGSNSLCQQKTVKINSNIRMKHCKQFLVFTRCTVKTILTTDRKNSASNFLCQQKTHGKKFFMFAENICNVKNSSCHQKTWFKQFLISRQISCQQKIQCKKIFMSAENKVQRNQIFKLTENILHCSL